MHYKRLILSELGRFDERLDEIIDMQSKMREELAALKVQSGLWGLVGGAIPAVVTVILVYLSTHSR